MRCKKCEAITKHRYAGLGRVECEVCGTERDGKKINGDFPELTWEENEIVHEARACGFASCFPCYPTAEAQARNTLAGAKRFLETHGSTDKL